MKREYPFLCPKCGGQLHLRQNSYFCENNHCYDVARQGYTNLILANQKNSTDAGDNAEMIVAREQVMDKGYYSALADDIIRVIKKVDCSRILDAGCGVGYIASKVAKELQGIEVLGTDISKNAIQSASKRYKEVAFAVASSIRLPIKSDSVDVCICAFAPIYAEEMARVLKEDGVLIKVSPAEGHLLRLKELLYEKPYLNIPDTQEVSGFTLIDSFVSRSSLTVAGDVLYSVVKMTPYYYHSEKKRIEELRSIVEPKEINLEFDVRVFKKVK